MNGRRTGSSKSRNNTKITKKKVVKGKEEKANFSQTHPHTHTHTQRQSEDTAFSVAQTNSSQDARSFFLYLSMNCFL